jgi:predicted nucleotidyltransferase
MKSLITPLSKTSKLFYKKYKEELQDIVLFGSVQRGKEKPRDIDILLIFTKKVDKNIEYAFKKCVNSFIKNVSLHSKKVDALYEDSFVAREAIFFEGYSVIDKKTIASKYGFTALGMFRYHTKPLSNVEKTKFYHALNGRREKEGMLAVLQAIKVSDNLFTVPLEKIEFAKAFLDHWDLEYTYVPLLLPSRLAKKHIIGKVI